MDLNGWFAFTVSIEKATSSEVIGLAIVERGSLHEIDGHGETVFRNVP